MKTKSNKICLDCSRSSGACSSGHRWRFPCIDSHPHSRLWCPMCSSSCCPGNCQKEKLGPEKSVLKSEEALDFMSWPFAKRIKMNLYLHHHSAVGSRRNYTQTERRVQPKWSNTMIYLVQIHCLLQCFACEDSLSLISLLQANVGCTWKKALCAFGQASQRLNPGAHMSFTGSRKSFPLNCVQSIFCMYFPSEKRVQSFH